MHSLNIAIDASRTAVEHSTGTEYYSRRLIQELIEQNIHHDTPHHITLYFRDKPAPYLFPESSYTKEKVIPFRRVWTHLRFAAEIWRDRPDVTFVPAHTLPFAFPGRAVVTVHDLGFKYFPETHPVKQRLYLDWTTRYSARRAAAVLADSKATADDLIRFYGTPPDKIHIAYPGVDPLQYGRLVGVRQKYNLPKRYFLFIGTLQPRKNIARIVQAFARWKESHPDDDTGLVLAGGKGWLYDESWTAGVDGVHMPGYIDDADKGTLYIGALALVFPTLYEGFGFPVIEAMRCGVPVIASNTSSLSELVGDAGLLIDPLDLNAITVALDLLAWNSHLRDELRDKGFKQAAKFTWRAAAKQMLEVLETAAKD